MKAFCFLVLLTLIAISHQTFASFVGDLLLFEGEQYQLCQEPLEPHLENRAWRPNFDRSLTWCARNNIASWKISDNVLYLTDIHGSIASIPAFDFLFPNNQGKEEATWFSGTLRIAQGEIVGPNFGRCSSVHEWYLLIHVEDGEVLNVE